MTLSSRLRASDPLGGELPAPLPPPAVEGAGTQAPLPPPAVEEAESPAPPRRRSRAAVVLVATVALACAVLVASAVTTRPAATRVASLKLAGAASRPVASTLATRSAAVLRARLHDVGGARWRVEPQGDLVEVSCRGCEALRAARVVQSVAATGLLRIFSWEASHVGPACRPGVPPGLSPGVAGHGSVTRYAAVMRAARCPAAEGGAVRFYAVDPAHRRVTAGPTTLRAARRQGDPVRVAADVSILRAVAEPGTAPSDAWFVLRGRPALTGTDLRAPHAIRGATGAPEVAYSLTPRGSRALRRITRRSGAAPQRHFAIALDDRLLVVPYVDSVKNPDGIDGRRGSVIAGGFTVASARALAAVLESGVLPAPLGSVH